LAVAERLKGFSPNRILYCNRNPKQNAQALNLEYVDFDTLLKESDFLICTCAATKETEKIFDISKFKKMKSSSIFINVSRGSVVNQKDLHYALENEIIFAAGTYISKIRKNLILKE
jgi:lactate dehydrogenase-like 2-hydroxyacid dehydrogenase